VKRSADAPRFYVDADLCIERTIALPAEIAHHAVRVLRLRDGDGVTLFSGRGGEFEGRLRLDGPHASARLGGFHDVERESPLPVTLIQSWVATEKLELIVEKAVELGVASILLVPAARSVVHLDGARRERRLQRLKEIVVSACCQCGRNRLPGVEAAASLQEGFASALGQGVTGILLDPNDGVSLASIASGAQPVALAVGPEGGFTETERALAERMGFRAMRLGPRILRTETAGLAGLAALQALHGDLR